MELKMTASMWVAILTGLPALVAAIAAFIKSIEASKTATAAKAAAQTKAQ